jgi:hypothetical protein
VPIAIRIATTAASNCSNCGSAKRVELLELPIGAHVIQIAGLRCGFHSAPASCASALAAGAAER